MKFINRRAFAVGLGLLSLLPGRASAIEPATHRPRIGEVWARTELYFGTERAGEDITDGEFLRFMDRQITERFPDGLTLLSGRGQFLNSRGVLIKERSKVLILFYPLNAKDASRKIEEIREKYKDEFDQESVLRVDSHVLLSF